jgi:hypothetical protein
LRAIQNRLELRVRTQEQVFDVFFTGRKHGRDGLPAVRHDDRLAAPWLNVWCKRGNFGKLNGLHS